MMSVARHCYSNVISYWRRTIQWQFLNIHSFIHSFAQNVHKQATRDSPITARINLSLMKKTKHIVQMYVLYIFPVAIQNYFIAGMVYIENDYCNVNAFAVIRRKGWLSCRESASVFTVVLGGCQRFVNQSIKNLYIVMRHEKISSPIMHGSQLTDGSDLCSFTRKPAVANAFVPAQWHSFGRRLLSVGNK